MDKKDKIRYKDLSWGIQIPIGLFWLQIAFFGFFILFGIIIVIFDIPVEDEEKLERDCSDYCIEIEASTHQLFQDYNAPDKYTCICYDEDYNNLSSIDMPIE